jgi:hypothetical protein
MAYDDSDSSEEDGKTKKLKTIKKANTSSQITQSSSEDASIKKSKSDLITKINSEWQSQQPQKT